MNILCLDVGQTTGVCLFQLVGVSHTPTWWDAMPSTDGAALSSLLMMTGLFRQSFDIILVENPVIDRRSASWQKTLQSMKYWEGYLNAYTQAHPETSVLPITPSEWKLSMVQKIDPIVPPYPAGRPRPNRHTKDAAQMGWWYIHYRLGTV